MNRRFRRAIDNYGSDLTLSRTEIIVINDIVVADLKASMQNFNAQNRADNCIKHDDETFGNHPCSDLFEILKIDKAKQSDICEKDVWRS